MIWTMLFFIGIYYSGEYYMYHCMYIVQYIENRYANMMNWKIFLPVKNIENIYPFGLQYISNK